MRKFDEKRFDKYVDKKIENYDEERKMSLLPQFYPSRHVIRRMAKHLKDHIKTKYPHLVEGGMVVCQRKVKKKSKLG